MQIVKAKEKEMKDEKEGERQVGALSGRERFFVPKWILTKFQRRIQVIRDKRAAKAEKDRYEKMAEKMHKKRVERLRRREKRNKMLKSWSNLGIPDVNIKDWKLPRLGGFGWIESEQRLLSRYTEPVRMRTLSPLS